MSWKTAPQRECLVACGNADFHPPNEKTMNRAASVVTKDQLIEQFNGVVAETEQLLKCVATAGGETVGAMRASAEQSLANAKDRLLELQRGATDRAGAAARTTDRYVHEHPWQAIGVATGFAVFASVVVSLLLHRR
jgi:ElaB/YqjD/DUF883 family membrane-anchored ribosome-binding protein